MRGETSSYLFVTRPDLLLYHVYDSLYLGNNHVKIWKCLNESGSV